MFPRIVSFLIVNSLLVCPVLVGQAPDANERPVISSTSREVLVDMVVRDKHHHAVTDLRQEEVEVYEDGIRQSIRVFRNIGGAEQLQTERTVARSEASSNTGSLEKAPSLNSLRQVNFVSVV